MRVALDATPLSVSTGGVRRYVEQLSVALARLFPSDQFTLVSDQPFAMPLARAANLNAGAAPRGWIGRRWWLAGLARQLARLDVEVFHGTDFSVPYLPLRPSVMTIHDLSPWRSEGWQPEAGRIRNRTPALVGLGLASMIVTPSEAVRREVIARFRVHPDRVVAVPLAPAPALALAVSPSLRPPVPGPYFLFVGTLEPRKNLGLLIQAWRPVFETFRVPLVLAGRRRADFAGLDAEPGLVELGAVADERLAALYAGALACLYPSRYEGFGLPVLEAMHCGAPVIAARDPAIAETAGGAALLLDPGDARAWREALAGAAARPASLFEWRERGRRRAAEFSWERTARATREVYGEACRRFRWS